MPSTLSGEKLSNVERKPTFTVTEHSQRVWFVCYVSTVCRKRSKNDVSAGIVFVIEIRLEPITRCWSEFRAISITNASIIGDRQFRSWLWAFTAFVMNQFRKRNFSFYARIFHTRHLWMRCNSFFLTKFLRTPFATWFRSIFFAGSRLRSPSQTLASFFLFHNYAKTPRNSVTTEIQFIL